MYSTSVRSCSRCGKTHERIGQRLCHGCHAKAQRSYRARKAEQAKALEAEVTNAHELRAREKKAVAIVEWIWSNLTDAQKVDTEILQLVRLCDQEMRDCAAKLAGVNSPSEKTWRRVHELLTQRVKDAKWGFDRGRSVA